MREAWSVQKDRKGRREERREKRDLKKKWEWEKQQAETEGREIGMVEAFTKSKSKKRQEREELEGAEEEQKEYKALKREVQEEKMNKKGGRQEKVVGGAFDDLD